MSSLIIKPLVRRSFVSASLLLVAFIFLQPVWADLRRSEGEVGAIRDASEESVCGWLGQIHMLGNTLTPDSIILRQIPLKARDKITLADVRRAKRNLERLNLFAADPAPRVEVLDRLDDAAYKDMLVFVSERPENVYRYAIWESLRFAGNWARRGFPTAYLQAEESCDFPAQLIQYAPTGDPLYCPLALRSAGCDLADKFFPQKGRMTAFSPEPAVT